jgi:hypothetical protein
LSNTKHLFAHLFWRGRTINANLISRSILLVHLLQRVLPTFADADAKA